MKNKSASSSIVQDLDEVSIYSPSSSMSSPPPTQLSSPMSSPLPTPSTSLPSSSKKVREKPKQEQLKAEIALEKDILIGLHRKRDSAMMSEGDRKELIEREKNLKNLEKQLKAVLSNRMKQQNFRDNQKRRIESLDDETRKKVKGRVVSKVGKPKKYDDDLLISVITKDRCLEVHPTN